MSVGLDRSVCRRSDAKKDKGVRASAGIEMERQFSIVQCILR